MAVTQVLSPTTPLSPFPFLPSIFTCHHSFYHSLSLPVPPNPPSVSPLLGVCLRGPFALGCSQLSLIIESDRAGFFWCFREHRHSPMDGPNGSESDSESGWGSVCLCAHRLIGNCLVEALHLEYLTVVHNCHLMSSFSLTQKMQMHVLSSHTYTHTLLHEQTGKHPNLQYVATYFSQCVQSIVA